MNKKIFVLFGYTALILGAFSMVFPFLWMVLTSFMEINQIFSDKISLIPQPFIIDNYIHVFTKIPLTGYFINSLFVATLTTAGQIVISAMAAYGFSRMKFPFRDSLFFIILATMMIPPQVNIIPLFFMMSKLHWIDTYQALIIPGLFGGFGVFLLRQWFKSMPYELEESAKIDGCGYMRTFFQIILPLAMPAVATLGIFTFINTWNSFMWPLIVTSSDAMRTLPVGIAAFKGNFVEETQWGQLMTCAVISVIPVIAVFLAGQKFLIKSMIIDGMKD